MNINEADKIKNETLNEQLKHKLNQELEIIEMVEDLIVQNVQVTAMNKNETL